MTAKKTPPHKKKKSTQAQFKKLSQRLLLARQMTHAALLEPMHVDLTGQTVLGHAHAVIIVCACANTSPLNLPRTLAELGVDGSSFQLCVFNGVKNAGFQVNLDDIPDSPTTTLIAVVNAIENAPKA